MKRNIIYQYILQAARYFFPFVTLPYLTRVLGADVYGIRAYMLAAMSFFQIFLDYGFKAYGTREVSQGRDSKEKIGCCITSIVIPSGALCVVGLIVLLVISLIIPMIGDNLVYALVAYLGVCFKSNLPDFVFQGLEDMGIITKRFIVSQTVACVLIIAFVKGPDQLLLVPVFEAVASLIAFVWSWWDVVAVRGLSPRRVSKVDVLKTIRESSAFFFSNASTNIFTSLTTLMIGALISNAAQISYWSLAMTSISAIQSLFAPITNTLYPRMCSTHDYSLVRRFLLSGTALVVVGCVALWVFADTVMLVLGGPEYVDGTYVVRFVTPVILFSYPAVLLGVPVLASAGRTPLLTASSVISAVFHIAGLGVLALCGCFTIPTVAVLRCMTEAVLLTSRSIFSWHVIKAANVSI